MRKVLESLFPLCGWVGLSASLALAGEAATGPRTYNGISYFYYTVINLILIYVWRVRHVLQKVLTNPQPYLCDLLLGMNWRCCNTDWRPGPVLSKPQIYDPPVGCWSSNGSRTVTRWSTITR